MIPAQPVQLNIEYGFKAKVFAQYYRDMALQPNSTNLNLASPNNYNIYILGFDARYYTKISRDLIWANRLWAELSRTGKTALLYGWRRRMAGRTIR